MYLGAVRITERLHNYVPMSLGVGDIVSQSANDVLIVSLYPWVSMCVICRHRQVQTYEYA